MKQGFRRRRAKASPLTRGTSAELAPPASPVEAAGPDFPASESAETASGELVGARRMLRTARPETASYREPRRTPPKLDHRFPAGAMLDLGDYPAAFDTAIEEGWLAELQADHRWLTDLHADHFAPLRLIQEFLHNPFPINPAQSPSSTSPEEAQQRLAEIRYQLQLLAALQAVLTEELEALSAASPEDAERPHA